MMEIENDFTGFGMFDHITDHLLDNAVQNQLLVGRKHFGRIVDRAPDVYSCVFHPA
ncbi:hypothetical protein D3C87_1848270 [compost metagenome]